MTRMRAVTAQAAAVARPGEAPFLVWPVSRREFYMSIGVALCPPLAWGMIVFGWRMVGMLLATVAAAGIAHAILKRCTARGKIILLSHTILSAMVLVALCPPLWPGWMVAVAGAAIPGALWLLGGPGRERMHVAVVVLLLLQLLVPWLRGPVEWGEGILARDRLLMGDIRDQKEGSLDRWPRSLAIGGNDAVRVERPEAVALRTLDQMSGLLRSAAAAGNNEKALDEPLHKEAQAILDNAIGKQLPSPEMLMLGAVPARAGAASLIALVIGGLYLAYRYILRPRSVALFFVSYALAMASLAFWPSWRQRLGFAGLWEIWTSFPAELATLLSYAVFNSDVVFAAVIVLALPGTEPLTGRGRRVFLVAAGVLAAVLGRMNLGLPAATVALCALMPLASQFDHWFGKRSWMNRLRI